MTMTTSSLLPYAVAAVQHGFSVFPCDPGGKTPLVMGDGYRIRWGDAATGDIGQVAAWWRFCPMANVGIAAKPSGLLIVDCDEGPDKAGVDQFEELARRFSGRDPWHSFNTHTVKTGGGGMHLYYRWPEGVQATQAGLAKDVDIRSNGGNRGGYVLGAGSITQKGRYAVEYDRSIVDVPSWLQEICTDRPRPRPVPKPDSPYAHPVSGDYSGMAATVRLTGDGNRNNVLLWSARQMCDDGASEEKAMEVLLPAAEDSGLYGPDAAATIRSGYRLQSQKGKR